MTRRTKAEIEEAQKNMKGRELIDSIWRKIYADGAKSSAVARQLGISYSYLLMLRNASNGTVGMDRLPMETYRKMAKYLNVSLIVAMWMAEAITETEAKAEDNPPNEA